MKIGILTFSRVHNYGAILQCYALSEILKQMGHDVKIIEYKQPFLEALNRPFVLKEFIHRLSNPRSFLRYIKQYKLRLRMKRNTSLSSQFIWIVQRHVTLIISLSILTYT